MDPLNGRHFNAPGYLNSWQRMCLNVVPGVVLTVVFIYLRSVLNTSERSILRLSVILLLRTSFVLKQFCMFHIVGLFVFLALQPIVVIFSQPGTGL